MFWLLELPINEKLLVFYLSFFFFFSFSIIQMFKLRPTFVCTHSMYRVVTIIVVYYFTMIVTYHDAHVLVVVAKTF